MGKLAPGPLIEAALWLSLAVFFYALSFGFAREIEIYQFGAAAWPRAILILIAVAAVGQFIHQIKTARADVAAAKFTAGNLKHHCTTVLFLSLPFMYLILPRMLTARFELDARLHLVKLICAGVLLAIYIFNLRVNKLGAMLALPILFGALMQDFGFYSLAPVFAAAVMVFMGEHRAGRIALITAAITGVLLFVFVSLLFVGLPIGNISPFYEIGAGVVNLLQ